MDTDQLAFDAGRLYYSHSGASWSFIPIVETAWLNFLVVLSVIIWMKVRKIPFARAGLGALRPSRQLLIWVAGTMAVDSLATGLATPALTKVFGEVQQVARFADLPGNLPLLLLLLPFTWLIGGFGEEFFFRGFLLTAIAEQLGASRAAWCNAKVSRVGSYDPQPGNGRVCPYFSTQHRWAGTGNSYYRHCDSAQAGSLSSLGFWLRLCRAVRNSCAFVALKWQTSI